MNYQSVAEQVLDGYLLGREEGLSLLRTPDQDLAKLLEAAFWIRHKHFGRRVRLHVLMNAKSGLCPEDCGYCSQSSVSTAQIDRYPLLPREQLVAGALKAAQAKALRYCLVISARGPTDSEVEEVCEAVKEIKERTSLEICCSLGLLTVEQAKRLKEAGVARINHNLNTSEQYYEEICSTHTYQDRVETIKAVQAAQMATCCGVLAGMGEREEDLVDLALALRRLNVDSIPVNFLNPIPGTPLENVHELSPQKCLKILCLFRFLNPTREIKVGGGRELHLGHLQPLMFYPANSIFVGGYLTTSGQASEEAIHMIEAHGFEVEERVNPGCAQSSTISRL
ncbi:MAG: biotin synthase BioB [Nitrospira sp.]|nr:biotin synthase BioB [Nitrospira sp.]